MTAEPLPNSRGVRAARDSAPAPEPGRSSWPGLRLVPAGRLVAPRAPFAVLLLLLLAGALLTALLVNTQLAQDAFRLSDLTKRGTALVQREEVLQGHVEAAEAPTELARRAADLGMVPYRNPLFLRLPDGAILGAPSAPAQPMIAAPGAPADAAPSTSAAPSPAASVSASPDPGAQSGSPATPQPTPQPTLQPTPASAPVTGIPGTSVPAGPVVP
jgi:hypothetical protein